MNFDDIENYLPKYLSEDSYQKLLTAVKQFPENIDQRIYSNILNDYNSILQGDCISNMPVVNLPILKIGNVDCIILSNSCDNFPDHQRYFPTRLTYAPIFNLNKFINKAKEQFELTSDQITGYLSSIKRQEITQILYLPKIENKLEESIVFFDRINNCSIEDIDSDIKNTRKFSLSDYGFYLFIVKLSIHFSRIMEKVDRN
ncbi:MAG: hypothetical protein PHT07_08685 [Paludibacter sp.]|nr:hypothetical protein [Paludibacter sp.]